MKLKSSLLFITILVLLAGVVTATNVSTDTNTPTGDTQAVLEKAVQEKPTVSTDDTNTVENIKEKQETGINSIKTTKNIQKNTNTLKKDSSVNSWAALESEINSATGDKTILITNKTIINTNTISLNKAGIDITIDGQGNTIDGNQKQVFNITSGSSLILKNIIIENAETTGAGGAIDNSGNLIIINSTLKNNKAQDGGAINNYGTVTLMDSNLTDNTATGRYDGLGGAIYNEDGTVNINNTKITQNIADFGGAIFTFYGNLNINNTNITYNTANNKGGAIFNSSGTNTFSNTTFYMNTPLNFIINQDNHIQLIENDNFITVGTFSIIVDDNEVYHGNGEELGEYTVSQDSLNVKLILHETDTNTNNNVFILRQPKELNVTNYTELVNAIEDAKKNEYPIYTINLQPGNYNATQDITWSESATRKIIINGNGLTLDGLKKYQFISMASDHNLTLENITITNYQSYHGAIDNSGNLTIINSTLKNNNANYGGAINNNGNITLINSTLKNNNANYGGAINNNGNITLINSTFTQNTASDGGAINNNGNITLININLTQNSAKYGGAVFNNNSGIITIYNTNLTQNEATRHNANGYGGAIYNELGTIIINNTNFTHNNATGQNYGRGGAINNNCGTMIINNTNFFNNNATEGGAISNYNGGTITNSNTTFYNNTPANFIINQDNYIQLITTDNFISGGTFTIIADDEELYKGNLESFSEYVLSPDSLNVKLILNGTDTNAKNNVFILRKIKEVNINSYEELVQTIEEATEEQYDKFIINLQSGNYNATQSIDWAESTTPKIMINGNGLLLDGLNTHQFIKIAQGNDLTLKNITITNYTSEYGGAIFNDGNLTVMDSSLSYNYAEECGGAISNDGNLTVMDSSLSYNYAEECGGVIFNDGNLTVKDSTINNNNAGEYGGAIVNNCYTYEIINTTFYNNNPPLRSKEVNITNYTDLVNAIEDAKNNEYYPYIINLQQGDYNATQNIIWTESITRKIIINGNGITLNGKNTYQFIYITTKHDLTLENITITNYTAEYGGAVDNSGNLTIFNSALTQNTANYYGGAINNNGNITLINTNLTQNTANYYGGAIFNAIGGTLNINNSIFTQNNATYSGGALYNQDNSIINNTNFTKNTANLLGGAICTVKALSIINSNFTYNSASRGSAINDFMGTFSIINSNFTQNTAELGTISGSYDDYNITNSSFLNNTATGQDYGWGGAIYNDHVNVTIVGTNFTQNTAKEYGGALYNNIANMTIMESYFAHNNANTYGGAIAHVGHLDIVSTNFTENTANTSGGAVYLGSTSYLNITNSNITLNAANTSGGAIYTNQLSFLNITNSNVTLNTANVSGGAIYISSNGRLNITKSNVTLNTANASGGAIYIGSSGMLNIINSNVTLNTANNSGAIYNNRGNLSISSSVFSNNIATSEQTDAIYSIPGTRSKILIENSSFTENNMTFNKNTTTRNLTLNMTNNTFTNTTFNINNINQNGNISVYITENKLNKSIGHLKDYIEPISVDITGINDNYEYYDDNRTYIIGDNVRFKENTTIKITVNNSSPIIYDNITVTINLTDSSGNVLSNRNVSLTINDGEPINLSINEEIATTNVSFDTAGDNTLKVKFDGDIDYNDSNDTIIITSQRIPTDITATLTNNIIRNTTINVTVTDIHNDKTVTIGQIEVYDNNDIKIGSSTINPTGNTQISLDINTKNVTQLKIKYLGTDEYINSSYILEDVVIVGRLSSIEFTDENLTYANISILVIVKDPVTNTNISNAPLRINLPNGTTIQGQTDKNGYYTIKEDISVGKNTLTVEFTGNDEYNSSSQNHTIMVIKRESTVTAAITNNTLRNTTIKVTVCDKITGNSLNTGNIAVIDTNTNNVIATGVLLDTNPVIITTNIDTAKTYTLRIDYKGNNNYTNSNCSLNNITIQKRASATIATINNQTAGNNTLTVTVTDKTTKQSITTSNIEIINNANNKTVAKAKITGKNTTITTNLNESGTYNLTVKYIGNEYYNTSQYVLKNVNIQKRAVTITLQTINNTLNNTQISITITDKTTGKKIPNAQITIKLPNDKLVNTNTGTAGTTIQTLTLPTGKSTVNVTFTGTKAYNNISKNHTIDVKKLTTKTTITPINAYLKDKITLTAKVTASNNIAVNEGNVIFKINGVTIKDNGKLSGSDNPLKIKVTNGVATTTIIADASMRNARQITAHYIENNNYTASNSTTAKITLKARNATITVTTNTKTIKHGQTITIIAKVYDTTKTKKTSINSTADEFVYFKINGITLKNAKGEMIKVKVINGVATIKYTIPLGLSCITDTQTLTPKNQTILAVFYSKDYQDNIKNTTIFQVERSNITINIANATINNKTHTLSMKITIKDYLKNTVAGPNKLVIKVNGLTLKNGTNVQYYYTTDGVLNLKNIPVPQSKNYTSIEVITQDRLAYNSQRNTTKVIKITN